MTIVFMVGFVLNLIGGVMVLVQAFKVSVGWGLAVMFIPFAGLYFIIKNWDETKKGFLVGTGGGVLMVLSAVGQVATAVQEADTTVAEVSAPRTDDEDRAEPPRSYASAAAPVAYEPRRSADRTSAASYTPSYAPLAPPPAPAATDTQAPEDDWRPKPKYEQVYVDRQTGMFYAETCKKRPENTYRIPRSVALMQGMPEAACR